MDPHLAELPVLRLGLVGFNSAQQALFATALVVLRTRMQWKLVALADADAICINGSRAVALADGSLEIASSQPGAPPVRLDPDDSTRPVAFTLPVAATGIQPSCTFDMGSPASTRSMLEKFEGWLRPKTVQYCLASQIIQDHIEVISTVHHVTVDGRLVAVVSPRNGVGVLPIADPFHLKTAVWARRPVLADEIPSHFVQAGLAEVLWQYAIRTKRNLLPASFRTGPIYWCRPPQVPPRLFKDSHLMIVRELAHDAADFADLAQRTGMASAVLARDLAALRIVGAITQDKKLAQRLQLRPTGVGGKSLEIPVERHSTESTRGARIISKAAAESAAAARDHTVPAPLRRQDND